MARNLGTSKWLESAGMSPRGEKYKEKENPAIYGGSPLNI